MDSAGSAQIAAQSSIRSVAQLKPVGVARGGCPQDILEVALGLPVAQGS
jgi:hypothetical protein